MDDATRLLDTPVRSIDWAELITVDAALSVRAAATAMTAHGVGALVVTDHGSAQAIVTERDITRAVGSGLDLDRSRCADAASPTPVTVDADDPIRVVARRLLEDGIRHVPVARSGQIVTVLSIRDVLAAILDAEERP